MDADKKIVCGVNSFGPFKTVYALSVQFDRYFLKEPEITDGHFESAFVRNVTASLPWIANTGKP